MARLLTALLLVGLLAAAPSAASAARWTVEPQPPQLRDSGSLLDVDMLSPVNAWAVGSRILPRGTAGLIEGWDGDSWNVVASPLFAPRTSLRAVAAATTDDVWAVGYTETDDVSEPSRTLAMHYDGERWRRVPTPNRANATANNLYAVDAVSSGEAIAVGSASTDFFASTKTLIMRWTGERWRMMPSPSANTVFNELIDVAIAPSGAAYALNTGAGESYVLRRAGRRWVVLPRPPSPGRNASYEAIDTLPGGDLIAVGGFQTLTERSPARPLVARWDGRRWARVAAANQRVESFFHDVSAAGNTIFAVGTALIGTGDSFPIVERSTGGRFTPMPVPDIFGGALNAVSAASPEHAFAVGDSYAAMAGPISLRLE